MSNIKELVKEKLNQLSKEELVDIFTNGCTIYVSANIILKASSDNIQQYINNMQTELQQINNVLT